MNFHTILHERHSGLRSLADPDATPRPSPVSPAAQRASEAPCSSVYVNAEFADEDKTREARVLDRLAALTRGTGGMTSLAAAQALFNPRLRRDQGNV